MRTLGGIRTRTVDVLNVVSLPLDHEGIGRRGGRAGHVRAAAGSRTPVSALARRRTAVVLQPQGAMSSVRGSNPVLRMESPVVYLPQPHGRSRGPTVELRKSNSAERIQGMRHRQDANLRVSTNKKPPDPRPEVGGVDAHPAALPAPPLQITTGFVASEA